MAFRQAHVSSARIERGSSWMDRLISHRFRSPGQIGALLENEQQRGTVSSWRSRRRPKQQHQQRVLKGVHRGVYYRIRLPAAVKPKYFLPNLRQLPAPTQLSLMATTSLADATATTTPCGAQTVSCGSVESVAEKSSSVSSIPLNSSNTMVLQQHHHQHHGRSSSQLPPPPPPPREETWTEFKQRLRAWWRANWSVLVFNFGSICSLTGFTRSDVLELRMLSVTGSLCAVVYNVAQVPFRITPIVWSLTFAAVNAYHIYNVIQERQGAVHLSAREQAVYVQHFLPHGVTPKQFEAIYQKAEKRTVPAGTVLIRQGDPLTHIYLVMEGSTEATILGRYLTAASVPVATANSTSRGAAAAAAAATSGAWIGEMAFLEQYGQKKELTLRSSETPGGTSVAPPPHQTEQSIQRQDQHSQVAISSTTNAKSVASSKASTITNGDAKPGVSHPSIISLTRKHDPVGAMTLESKVGHPAADVAHAASRHLNAQYSMFTIVAKDPCTVLIWSHSDMETLLQRSAECRAAMTRAMTSAIVGKVITYTMSRSKAAAEEEARLSHTWLDRVFGNANANPRLASRGVDGTMRLQRWHKDPPLPDEIAIHKLEDVNNGQEENPLPTYPLRKFKK